MHVNKSYLLMLLVIGFTLFVWSSVLYAGWEIDGSDLNLNSGQSAGDSVVGFGGTIPYVVWSESNGVANQIVVKHLDSGSWQITSPGLNTTNTANANAPSLTFDGVTPLVAWTENNGSNSELYVKRYNLSTWDPIGGVINIDPMRTAYGPSLGYDNGNPYVAWSEYDGAARQVWVRMYNGTDWIPVGPSLNESIGMNAVQPDLAFYGNLPYVAFVEYNGTANQLYVKRYNGTGWEMLGPGSLNTSPGENANTPDLEIWNGTPFVSWTEEQGGASQVIVKEFNGTAWQQVGSALNNNVGMDAYYPSLTISSLGRVAVAWQETTVNGTEIFAKYFSAAWVTMGASLNNNPFDAGTRPHLIIEGTTPYVVWQESASSVDKIHMKHWEPVTHIYRSVGPGITSAIIDAGSIGMTIAGDVATFSSNLPGDVGVGDVIQYDATNDGAIDTVAFIHKRLSPLQYEVKNAGGSMAVPTISNDQDWSIHRAYTSLNNAESGNENPAIDATYRNFDTWIDGRDLVVNQEAWHIACYNDGIDSTPVALLGWTTDAEHYIDIFTPVDSSHVGTSQRHDGTYGAIGYKLEVSSTECLIINTDAVEINGLLLHTSAVTGPDIGLIRVASSGSADIKIANNVFKGEATTAERFSGIHLRNVSAGTLYIWNNIFYDFLAVSANNTMAIGIDDADFSAYIYNNTIVDCNFGIRAVNGLVYAKSNVIQNCVSGFSGSAFLAASDRNLSNASDAPGTNPVNNALVIFEDYSGDNFHLSPSDIYAQNQGIDFSTDPNLAFNRDIDWDGRVAPWDIGADEVTVPAVTLTPTLTPTATPTSLVTLTPTQTWTMTSTPSPDYSPTPSTTPTLSSTATPTNTPTLIVSFTPSVTATEEIESTLTRTPTVFQLLSEVKVRRNILRPGSGTPLRIDVPLDKRQHVIVKIYNRRGRLIKTVVDRMVDSGNFEAAWEGLNEKNRLVGSGVYIVHIKTESINEKKKIAVVR